MAQIIDTSKVRARVPMIVVGIIILVILVVFGSSFFTVIDAGEVGVKSLFGKVDQSEIESGFHLKNPLAKVEKMDVKTQEYTMSSVSSEGAKMGDDSIDVLTKEGLGLKLDVTVLYRLTASEAAKVYKEIGIEYREIIVRPEIRNTIREVASQYTAQELYSGKRTETVAELNTQMETKLKDRGLTVESVLLRDIKLPSELKAAIEAKQAAEQEAQKMEFVLDKEQKEAERKRVESAGIRDAQEIIAQKLTPEYLRWYSIDMMKQLAESQNSTYIFIPTDGNGMPIVNINPGQSSQ